MRGFRLARLLWPLVLCLTGCASARATVTITAPPGKTVYLLSANDLGPQVGYLRITTTALRMTDGQPYWSITNQWIPDHVLVAPILAGGVVVTLADANVAAPTDQQPLNGKVVGLNPADGRALWQTTVGAYASPPLLINGTLYLTALRYTSLTNRQKLLYAIRPTDGHILWGAPIDGAAYNDQITQVGTTLVITSNDRCSLTGCQAAYLIAARLSDGAVLWDDRIAGNQTLSAPVALDGVIFTRTATTLAAFSLNDGQALWQRDLWQSPVIQGGGAFLGGNVAGDPGDPASTNAVMRVTPGTATPLWSAPSGLFPTVLAVDGATVYAQSKAASVDHPPYVDVAQAINATTGASVWQTTLAAPFERLIVQDGALYGASYTFNGTQENFVIALDPATGAVRWRVSLGQPTSALQYVDAVLVYDGGTLFAAFRGTDLFAVRATDGAKLWHYTVTGGIAGLAIGGA